MYDEYNRLQQSQRVWEAELNTLKAKLQILAKDENLARNQAHREEILDYQKRLSDYEVQTARHNSLVQRMQADYSDWLIRETEKARNLKIVVPHELQETYVHLSRLGK